ncbi:hypothetical protein KSP35_22640 [Aquihabitans sp. G128]|uniref:hypothetical protein n=1 Tax=Aquihabitans sp. G128 TaxID=2849779 RepID=UPI001C213C77|nr:hypothetical protein [Aquihabitans sp. G128]QXC61075.1 hypothetical protein KSP35_22640 [Aquihabitans sp. G128]
MIGLSVVLWTVTALGGLALAGVWYRALRRTGSTYDPGYVERGAVTAGKVAPHATLAVGGLILFAATAAVPAGEPKTAARVLALVLLVVGMGIGTAMFTQWMKGRSDSEADAALPAAVVIGHGLLAVATLVVAVIATIAAR